jgi:hypothetical protein
LAHITDASEKVALLRNNFSAFCIFNLAARTLQTTSNDVICLCNGTVIPRDAPRHLLETTVLSSNLVTRTLDELILPMRKLMLNEAEVVVLIALIILDPDARGLTSESATAIGALRDRVQNALFQMIRDRVCVADQPISTATSRFGNILLLLPPIAKVSSLLVENVQFSRMFGSQAIDPFLVEIFIDGPTDCMAMPNARGFGDRSDVCTQTLSRSSPENLTSFISTSSSTGNRLPPPLVVPTPASYGLYFPYGAPPYSTPPASAAFQSHSAGPYIGQQSHFFDGNHHHPQHSAEVTGSSFRFL